MQMKELWLGPEELLFQEGELDQKLYFVFKGEIEIFIKRQEKYQFQNDITLGGFKVIINLIKKLKKFYHQTKGKTIFRIIRIFSEQTSLIFSS